ncbi:MAG TPA: diguanylate cyclase [Epulopiscium sp.]|nr:diguanylate cyclase [Candidatus Epulonipiscium sp.]
MLSFKEKQLRRVIEISANFIDSTAQQLSCQEVSDYMLELSQAKYVSFNIYNLNKKDFKTVALSGIQENIKKAVEILGFKIVGNSWKCDPIRTAMIKGESVLVFEDLCTVSRNVLPYNKVKVIESIFKTGEVVIVNIIKDKEAIGDFTLIMDKNKSFDSHDIVKLYASQVALLIAKIRATKEYEKGKGRLESIIEATNVGTWEWNVQTGESVFNERWAQIIGYTLEELAPINLKKWHNLLSPNDKSEIEKRLKDVFSKKETYYSVKYRMKHKKGHWVSILDQGKVVSWTKDDKPLIMLGTHLDITESERLKEEYERFFAISTDLFCIADIEGNLIHVNNSWERLLGYSPDYLKSQNFLSFVHAEDIRKTKEAMEKLELKEKIFSFVNRYRYCDGSYRYIEWISQAYDNLIYGSGRDITESYEKQQQVEFLSFRDYLTGLYNRRYMEDAIKRLDTWRNLPLTLMVVDIKGLKLTNDAFGHEMGDKLIKVAVKSMKKACRSDDVIGRVGGDEFLVLLPNTNYSQAKNIKERMMKKASNMTEDSLIVSFAIGYAVKTMPSQSIIEIEKTADKNMYRHKAKYGKLMRNKTVESVLATVFSNDYKEQIHAEGVSFYCEQIARAMGLSPNDIGDAKMAGILHDIGKITIPLEISNKLGKLKQDEWEEVKRHPITGYNILKGVDEYAHLAEGVLYHHERPDGRGYPQGLGEAQIPLLSKIIAVADAYEAMTSNRLYKKAKTQDEAIIELKKHSGTQFDSEIIEVFIDKVVNQ